MAIKNSIAIEMKDGLSLPAENVIVAQIAFPKPAPQYNEEGAYTGNVIRKIEYTLFPYKDEVSITTEGVEFVSGEMKLIPLGWSKEMTPAEYVALLADGSLAEVWLKDQIAVWTPGNNPTVIDPYDIP